MYHLPEGSPSDIIHKQISFLDKLRKMKTESILPFIPTFEVNSAMKKIARERKSKQDVEKWNHFVKTCKETDCNSVVTADSKLMDKHNIVNDLPTFNSDCKHEDDEDNVFTEVLKFKKPTEESKTKAVERNEKEYYRERLSKNRNKPLDFNTLLLQVQRERKRKKDNEKWRKFVQKKSQKESRKSEASHYQRKHFSNDKEIDTDFRHSNDCFDRVKQQFSEESKDYNADVYLNYTNRENEENMLSWESVNNICNNLETCKEVNNEQQGIDNIEECIQELPVFNLDFKKLELILVKIVTSLNSIQQIINKNKAQVFAEEDLTRIKQRSLQFGMRFKGNYSYRIKHQLTELRHLLTCFENNKNKSNVALENKLISVYQGIHQAFQVIEKQLKTNTAIDLIKEPLCDFLLSVHELDSVVTSRREMFGDFDVENLKIGKIISETIDELKGVAICCEVSAKSEPRGEKDRGKQAKAPPWAKKSVALARTKFGPPVRLRNNKSINSPSNKLGGDVGSESNKVINAATEASDHLDNFSTSNYEQSEQEKELASDVTLEEPVSKIIAKKIQEVPGVDEELRKVEDVRIKMMSLLLNIKKTIEKNRNKFYPLEDDLHRIKLRTLEFGTRFKRNYFYRTKCQIHELRSMDPNPLAITKKSKILLIIQKLTAAHLSGFQALQVIEKQLQTISVIGLTQDLICSFYHFIFELTVMLKPFYGYLKTETLDDVERLIKDTIKILEELKHQGGHPSSMQCRPLITRKIKQKKNVPTKSRGKFSLKTVAPCKEKVVPKQRHSSPMLLNQVNEPSQTNSVQENKDLNFMMSVRQRPGAQVRRMNFKNNDIKTMVQLLAETEMNGSPARSTGQASSELLQNLGNANVGEDALKLKDPDPAKEKTPANVKLVIMTSAENNSENLENAEEFLDQPSKMWENLINYRNEFKEFKKGNSIYKKSLQPVRRMTERLADETLKEAFNCIISHLDTDNITNHLKRIIDEE